MAAFPPEVVKTLLPAVEAARAALRKMRADEIPAEARRIASYSGGRLPPPLAASLIDILDGNERLREKALEHLDGDGAARRFLARDPGWWIALAAEAVDRSREAGAVELAKRSTDADRLAEQLDETKRRLAAATESRAAEFEELKEAAAAAKARLRAHRERESDRTLDGTAELDEARAATRAAEERAEEAEALNSSLRASVRRLRRERAELERRARAGGSTETAELDALELARKLDREALLRRRRVAGGRDVAAPDTAARPLALPPGVRPDAAEAIDWLLTVDDPVVVVVDGYNVSFHLQGEAFSSPRARERLNQGLAVLARRGHSVLRISVVYDSSLAEGREPGLGPKGVTVLFAPRDRLADEEIVALVAGSGVPAVVISSDREVRDMATEAGAVALWGEALAGWMQRAG